MCAPYFEATQSIWPYRLAAMVRKHPVITSYSIHYTKLYEMLEYGMPPTFGAASLGERFFAYLVDKPIRETQYFPLMRPKAQSGE